MVNCASRAGWNMIVHCNCGMGTEQDSELHLQGHGMELDNMHGAFGMGLDRNMNCACDAGGNGDQIDWGITYWIHIIYIHDLLFGAILTLCRFDLWQAYSLPQASPP
jgi:hypothetical protein